LASSMSNYQGQLAVATLITTCECRAEDLLYCAGNVSEPYK